eukprot:9119737-Alexandrium_andersonii.AAC.1
MTREPRRVAGLTWQFTRTLAGAPTRCPYAAYWRRVRTAVRFNLPHESNNQPINDCIEHGVVASSQNVSWMVAQALTC